MSTEKEAQHLFAKRIYDQRGSTYEDSWHPSFAAKFISFASLQPGQRVLDLACGIGLVTFLAASEVGPSGAVIGVDISSGMLAQARARKEREVERLQHVRLFEHDITDLGSLPEIEAGSFDVVTCASAFVLLDNPFNAAEDWARYLKPEGKLVVDVPHPQNHIGGMVMERVWGRLDLPVPYHRSWVTSESSLREVLQAAGLKVEKLELVEQAGYGVRYHELEECDEMFEKNYESEFSQQLRTAGMREEARELFREEWKRCAEDGKVKDVDGVYVAVARRDTTHVEIQPSNAERSVIRGGCRCGKVRYTANVPPQSVTCCYCTTCRKLSGSAFMAFADFPVSAIKFHISSGLRTLELSTHARRAFCSGCGSPISMMYHAEPHLIGITMGSFDEECLRDITLPPVRHIFLKERASWYALPNDGSERYEEMPSMSVLGKP